MFPEQAVRHISIHALREEGDARLRARACVSIYFYPRPPRGGRPGRGKHTERSTGFLSTPSARRATFTSRIYAHVANISIHALREEGDLPLSLVP